MDSLSAALQPAGRSAIINIHCEAALWARRMYLSRKGAAAPALLIKAGLRQRGACSSPQLKFLPRTRSITIDHKGRDPILTRRARLSLRVQFYLSPRASHDSANFFHGACNWGKMRRALRPRRGSTRIFPLSLSFRIQRAVKVLN